MAEVGLHGCLRQKILQSPGWRGKDDLLISVPGVGEQVSLTLLAELPQLGVFARKQIAVRVGVAPFIRNSGPHRGTRMVWGGRAKVLAVLYMEALAATRYNPVLRPPYQRLLASGNPKKLPLTTCIRKLLTILNSPDTAQNCAIDPGPAKLGCPKSRGEKIPSAVGGVGQPLLPD